MDAELQPLEADSAPAAEAAPEPQVEDSTGKPISKWSPEEYKTWRETGKTPTKAVPAAADEPAEAQAEGEQPEKADSAPAAKPKQKTQQTTERRIQELLQERHELREKLAELSKNGKQQVQTESRPASKLEAPKRPQQKDFSTWEDYESALAKHVEDLADYKISQALEEREQKAAEKRKQDEIAQRNREIEKSWMERKTAAEAKHADFAETVKDVPLSDVMDAWILDSDIGAEVLYWLGQNRSDAKRISELNPFKAARELTKLEDKLSGPLASTRRVTQATPPAREVRATATTGDEAQAAIQRGDFAAYQAIVNRREAALRTGRG